VLVAGLVPLLTPPQDLANDLLISLGLYTPGYVIFCIWMKMRRKRRAENAVVKREMADFDAEAERLEHGSLPDLSNDRVKLSIFIDGHSGASASVGIRQPDQANYGGLMLKGFRTRTAALAAGGVMVLSLGAGVTALTSPANAATPSCGSNCANIFSAQYAATSSVTDPTFVLDVKGQGQKVGTPVILFRASNSDPAEDFTYSQQGTVQEFWEAGLVDSAIALHYGCVTGTSNWEFATCPTGTANDEAYEIEYAPYGTPTGLCVGIATTAGNGTKVSLQPCGESSKTVWIWDTIDQSQVNGFVVAINGSDTNFSEPYALNYPSSGYPTDQPRPQLQTWQVQKFATPADIPNNELWSTVNGVLP